MEEAPGVAVVGGAVDLAALGAEVDAGGGEGIGVRDSPAFKSAFDS